MKLKVLPSIAAALLMSACTGDVPASRSVADWTLAVSHGAVDAKAGAQKVLMGHYVIKDVQVTVPQMLQVSEIKDDRVADIVWQGEPMGNRHRQVSAMLSDAMQLVAAEMTDGPDVIVRIDVTRFYAGGEVPRSVGKPRPKGGSTSSVYFTLSVIDEVTGEVLESPRAIVADISAGRAARAVGRTPRGGPARDDVIAALAQVLRRELSVEVDAEMIMSRGFLDPAGMIADF